MQVVNVCVSNRVCALHHAFGNTNILKMFFTLCLVRVRVCSESTRVHTQRRPLFSQHSAGMFCFVVDQALTIARLAIRLREAQLRDEPRLACTARG